jgi:hypothetical protein
VTERDHEKFKQHLMLALEHVNTLVSWGFIAVICLLCPNGGVDQAWEWLLMVACSFAGGMAGMNFYWSLLAVREANAIAKRYRS